MSDTPGTKESPSPTLEPSPWLPTLLIGVGLGGFVDGIVVHQILQWHHMVSDTHAHPVGTVAGLEANTLADGIFIQPPGFVYWWACCYSCGRGEGADALRVGDFTSDFSLSGGARSMSLKELLTTTSWVSTMFATT